MKQGAMRTVLVVSGFLLIGCLLVEPAQATILEVGPSGYPYTSIQAAINDAVTGDEVRVHDGTYYEKINFSGKAITVKSVNGSASTTIDGSASGSVVTFASREGSGSILDGFTITNGYGFIGGGIYCSSSATITNCIISGNSASNGGGIYCYGSPTIISCTITGNSAGNGGGIYCYFSSSPTITNCTVSGNSAGHGGGIYCDSSSPTITKCTITGNGVGHGGGIYCMTSSPTITECIIAGNSVSGEGGGIYCMTSSPTITNCIISGNLGHSGGSDGGGIYCEYGSSPTISNCSITGNGVGNNGGGIYCYFSSSPTITNCTITGNGASFGGGIYCEYSSSPIVTNSILWGNSDIASNQIWLDSSTITIIYSDVDQDGYAGSNGNIRQDPLFVNPANGDFRLQPTSPCIDAATSDDAPLTDMVGNPRFDAPWIPNTGGGTYPYYDMGALEYLTTCEGDFDGDGDVDGRDLWEFSTVQFGEDDLQALALEFGKTDCMD